MEDIANKYEISVSTIYDIIKLVEKTLCSCEEFKLPNKQKLKEDEPNIVVIDIAAKKGASEYYSGKKCSNNNKFILQRKFLL